GSGPRCDPLRPGFASRADRTGRRPAQPTAAASRRCAISEPSFAGRLSWRRMGETVSAILSSARKVRADPALYVGLAGDAPRPPGVRYSLAGIDRVDLVRGEARAATRR